MSVDSPPDLSRRDAFLSIAIPLLLVVIAAVQIVRVHTLDQSPWSGAGFGMFAAIDGEGSRAVVGSVVADGSATAVPLPASLGREAFELTVVPTEDAADQLARRWAEALDLSEGSLFIVEVRRVDLGDALELTTEVIVEGSSDS